MLICSMSGQRAVVAPLRDDEHCAALPTHFYEGGPEIK